MKLDGVPVLFIPGNAGSYKQGIIFHINNLETPMQQCAVLKHNVCIYKPIALLFYCHNIVYQGVICIHG